MGTVNRSGGGALGGWASFVAIFLLVVGGVHLIWGVAALANDDFFREDGLLFASLTTWAWISIVIGAIEIAGGLLVLARSGAGQIIALLIAMLGIFTSLFTLGAYPIWSLVAMGVDMLVIWAVTVHADEFVDD